MGRRFTSTQVRYFRRVRLEMAAAAERKQVSRKDGKNAPHAHDLAQLARRAENPRPVPKRQQHLEDVLFANGFRFVRPGGQDVLGQGPRALATHT